MHRPETAQFKPISATPKNPFVTNLQTSWNKSFHKLDHVDKLSLHCLFQVFGTNVKQAVSNLLQA